MSFDDACESCGQDKCVCCRDPKCPAPPVDAGVTEIESHLQRIEFLGKLYGHEDIIERVSMLRDAIESKQGRLESSGGV